MVHNAILILLSTRLTLSSILGLFLGSSPPTVSRLVVPLVVNPVKAQSFWPFAHVSEEVLEGLPLFADSDSPPAIGRIILMTSIVRPLFHVLPTPISGSVCHAVGKPALVSPE
jgi:hypothetical protein